MPSEDQLGLVQDRIKAGSFRSAKQARQWIARTQEKHGVVFQLEFLPPYSPNLYLIERMWKFLKKHALSDWHSSFEAMQQAVANVLDHLEQYDDELASLLRENFQLWPDEAWQACPTE